MCRRPIPPTGTSSAIQRKPVYRLGWSSALRHINAQARWRNPSPVGRGGRGRGVGAEPAVSDHHAEPGDEVELSRAYCLATNAAVHTRSR
jgi:hypothetical protein